MSGVRVPPGVPPFLVRLAPGILMYAHRDSNPPLRLSPQRGFAECSQRSHSAPGVPLLVQLTPGFLMYALRDSTPPAATVAAAGVRGVLPEVALRSGRTTLGPAYAGLFDVRPSGLDPPPAAAVAAINNLHRFGRPITRPVAGRSRLVRVW